MTSRRRAASLAAALLALAACGRATKLERPPGEIVFSILPTGPAAALDKAWAPMFSDMEKATGLKVTPLVPASAALLVKTMAARQADAGWFSNETGLEAVRHAGGEVFARTLGPNGEDGYQSVIVVGAKSSLTLDRVLKCDRTLTFGDGEANSTAEHIVPNAYLFGDRGGPPSKCFKSVHTQTRAANLAAVADGSLDVAASDTDALAIDKENGGSAARKVKIIWTSLPLPGNPLVWRKSLDPAVKETLRQFFLTYGQGDSPEAARQRAVLATLRIGGFQPADNTHLLMAREIEARTKWVEAKWDGDAARVRSAKIALDDITNQRLTVEARTRAPAATQ